MRERFVVVRKPHDPWHGAIRWVTGTVLVYLMLSLIWLAVWFSVTNVSAHHLSTWILGAVPEVFLTLGLLMALRYLIHHLLWSPVQSRVMLDELTGCLRPAAFWERFAESVTNSYRLHEPLTFAFLDLDDFKKINDNYGHQAGDSVLKAFGHLLQTEVRETDVIGRLGGEEFGWVLPSSEPQEAEKAVLRLLEHWAQVTDLKAKPTFSGGLASISGTENEPVSAWELAKAADQALYRVKAAGKANVAIAGEPLP